MNLYKYPWLHSIGRNIWTACRVISWIVVIATMTMIPIVIVTTIVHFVLKYL